MKIIKALAVWFLFLLVGAYICMAFATWNFNPSTWKPEDRELAIGIVASIWFVSALPVVLFSGELKLK